MSDKKPVLRIYCGAVKATAWAHEHDGKQYYSVNLARSYKDRDGQWKETTSISGRDLPAAANLLLEVWRTLEVKEPKGSTVTTTEPEEPAPF